MNVNTRNFDGVVYTFYPDQSTLVVAHGGNLFYAENVDELAFKRLCLERLQSKLSPVRTQYARFKVAHGIHSHPLLPVLKFDDCKYLTTSEHDCQAVPISIKFQDNCLRPTQLLKRYKVSVCVNDDGIVSECICADQFQRSELSECLAGQALVFEK